MLSFELHFCVSTFLLCTFGMMHYTAPYIYSLDTNSVAIVGLGQSQQDKGKQESPICSARRTFLRKSYLPLLPLLPYQRPSITVVAACVEKSKETNLQ